MKLMKFINTRLLVAFGAVLACASMYSPEVKGQTMITSPTNPVIIINNNTGNTLWVNVNVSSSAGISSVLFPLDVGASYPYPIQPATIYFQQSNTPSPAATDSAAYNVTGNAIFNVSLSSGQIKVQQQ